MAFVDYYSIDTCRSMRFSSSSSAQLQSLSTYAYELLFKADLVNAAQGLPFLFPLFPPLLLLS
jgi:hypothetical protein